MSSTSNLVRLPSLPGLSWDDCRLLVESVIDYAIFMLDEEGRVATWNVGAEKIQGYSAGEIIGQHFSIFFPAEDTASGKPEHELRTAMQLGRVEDEGWRVRKDGSRFWANVITTALRDPSGKLRGFGKVTRDLTTRRAAEERLHRTEERFHRLVDAVTDYAIYMLDGDGYVSTWNPGAERIKGYQAVEIIGQHFARFYTPEDRAAGKPQHVLDAVRRSGRFEEENWRVRKDGTRFWASVVLTAIYDDARRLVGFVKVTRDLTERRRADEDLRRSEERFRLLTENLSDYAIYVLDPGGVVTTWNRGAERMKGYSAQEVIGRSFECFFPTEDRLAGKPAQELALASSQARFEDEGWRVRKDGSRFWANAVLYALRDNQESLVGFAKITRDLTARRSAEDQERKLLRERIAREVAEREEVRLRESEQRYRDLSRRLEVVFEGVADGITVQEPSGRLVLANTAAARMCGFSTAEELVSATPEEVVAKFELLDADGKAISVQDLPGRSVLAGRDNPSALLFVRERADGRSRWVQVRATAVPGEDARPHLSICIWHDVTAQRQHDEHTQYLAAATAALGGSLEQDELLAAVAQALVPGMADWCSVYLLEEDHLRDVAMAHASSADSQRIHEYRETFAPDLAWEVARSGQSLAFNELHEQALKHSITGPVALEMLRALGITSALLVPIVARERVLGVIAFVCAAPGRRFGRAQAALAEEIGRRTGVALENARLYHDAQRAARAAAQAALRAEQAARSADEASRAKDEFLATVSHELRTPLNAILGWSTLLRDRTADAAIRKPLEIIRRNAQSQVGIIDDILDVSRLISGNFRIEPRPADLADIVRDAIEVVRPSADAKKVQIRLEPALEPCLLVADSSRLQQVVWNLLSNAIKFTEPGATIDVSTSTAGSRLVLTVKDTGQGIDPAFLPFVFERFRQADSSITRRVGGLGLGLARVRHIVELHGGRVEVRHPPVRRSFPSFFGAVTLITAGGCPLPHIVAPVAAKAESHYMTDWSRTSGIAPALVSHRDAKIKRAVKFLRDREAPLGFPSFIASDPSFLQTIAAPEELFTPMLVLNAFADAGLTAPDERAQLERVHRSFTPAGLVHFFADRSRLVADIDCTSVALELMVKRGARLPFDIDVTLDTIAANVDATGVLRVYIGEDASREDRVDAAACVNALYLFYLLERERDVLASEEYVWKHLTGPSFAQGTRYYSSPDIFLLFLSRLVRDFGLPRQGFTAALEDRLRERFATPDSNVLELAARVTAAANIGLVADQDIGELVHRQRADGSWPGAPCFRFGRQKRYFGSDSLSTAWGMQALAVSDGDLRSVAGFERSTIGASRFGRVGEGQRFNGRRLA